MNDRNCKFSVHVSPIVAPISAIAPTREKERSLEVYRLSYEGMTIHQSIRDA